MGMRIPFAFLASHWRIVAVVTLLAAGAIAWCLLNRETLTDYVESYETRNRLQDEVETLREQNRELQREQEMLTQGGFEFEKAARERFLLGKPEENVLVLERPAADDQPTTGPRRNR